jgi:NADH-quinone oxidoreductase subunit A
VQATSEGWLDMQPTLTPLAAVILLFLAVGVGFIFFHLLAGKFIRPNKPAAEKKTIYECGEPTIGSAWIQFDLRFYVVALLFVIFDVEVAFFFPWAEVFGRAQAVASAEKPALGDEKGSQEYGDKLNALIPDRPDTQAERERNRYTWSQSQYESQQFESTRSTAQQLVWLSLAEIAVFFGVLLVGFAYLWRRGDLEWVRSTLAERPIPPPKAVATTNGAGLIGAPAGSTLVEAGS